MIQEFLFWFVIVFLCGGVVFGVLVVGAAICQAIRERHYREAREREEARHRARCEYPDIFVPHEQDATALALRWYRFRKSLGDHARRLDEDGEGGAA